MLERLIQSLIDTAGGDQRYEILVAIDKDDEAWPVGPPHMPWSAARPVRWFHWDRPVTLGTKLNLMAAEAHGAILWFVSNDMRMVTDGWPAKFRRAVARLPNEIGVPFVQDALHPDHAAYPILTRKWMDAVGFLFPPCFPFWFIDTHVDSLGLMIDQHFQIDVVVESQGGRGRTHGLADLGFWADFYQKLEPIRLREAIHLIAAAHGEGTPAYDRAMRGLGQRQEYARQRTAHLTSPEFLARWSDNSASPPGPRYAVAKQCAEGMIRDLEKLSPKRQRIAIAVPSGRTVEASSYNCFMGVAAYSAAAGLELAMLNFQTSQISHGRNALVRLAMNSGCDKILWLDSDMKVPADTLVRLLRHGKDVVGGTYNKKTPRPDGSFETLGSLLGQHPDVLNDGLWEAERLPGGVLLVDMSVYRKLEWPWYGETYRWPGADGLVAFKALLNDYFKEVPPNDVLTSIDETAFGAWIKDHYAVADDGAMTSEDYFFCRKARRTGFKIWCDLSLTNEVGHLGEREVTCKLPENTVRLADAAD